LKPVDEIVQKYVVLHYGDLIRPDKANYDERTKSWRVGLRSTYPRIVDDEETSERRVRFLHLSDLGVVTLNDKLEVTDATSSEACDEQLGHRIGLWRKISEQIVTSGCSDSLARIAEGIHVLNPLKLVLEQLAKAALTSSPTMIRESKIEEQDRRDRIREYLGLLQELGIVRKVDSNDTSEGGYQIGNKLAMMSERVDDSKLLTTILMSHVIRERYSTLRQVFLITQLDPFIQLANCYYWPALEAGELVRATHSSLWLKCQLEYDWKSDWDFESKLSDLERQGALKENEKGYIVGDEALFTNMRERAYNDVLLNP